MTRDTQREACAIADRIVPQYRCGTKTYPCHGIVAKRWQAAFDAAMHMMTRAAA